MDIAQMLMDAFNEGYQRGLIDGAERVISADISKEGDNTIIYKINGKEYRQMTLEDLNNGL